MHMKLVRSPLIVLSLRNRPGKGISCRDKKSFDDTNDAKNISYSPTIGTLSQVCL